MGEDGKTRIWEGGKEGNPCTSRKREEKRKENKKKVGGIEDIHNYS